jgi:acyl-lipid omega-6 desaturase (Delta-12 desaturase)
MIVPMNVSPDVLGPSCLSAEPSVPGLPSLEEVRRVIPEACYRRSNWRGLRLVVLDTVVYLASLAAVIVLAVHHPVFAVLASVFTGFVVSAMFVVGHDAAHDALVPGARLNQGIALALMLPSLHVRDGWVFGHNRVHHGFTVKRGMDFVWHPVTPDEYALMSSARRALHRLEWSWAGAGIYYVRNVWWNKMIRFTPPAKSAPGVPRDRRIVGVFLVVASSASLACGWVSGGVVAAVWMWLLLIVVPFAVFSWVIGATVHIHHVQPDIPWFDGRDWTRSKAQLIGTTVMRVPWFIDIALHHIFIHVPHHVDARIPCYELSDASKAIDAAFPGIVKTRDFRLRDYYRSTKACKLFDFDASRWLTIADSRRAEGV